MRSVLFPFRILPPSLRRSVAFSSVAWSVPLQFLRVLPSDHRPPEQQPKQSCSSYVNEGEQQPKAQPPPKQHAMGGRRRRRGRSRRRVRPSPAATTNIPPPPSIPPSFSWARNNRPLLPFFYLRCPPPPPPSSGLVRPSSVRGDPSLEERCPQGENGGGRDPSYLPASSPLQRTNECSTHNSAGGCGRKERKRRGRRKRCWRWIGIPSKGRREAEAEEPMRFSCAYSPPPSLPPPPPMMAKTRLSLVVRTRQFFY